MDVIGGITAAIGLAKQLLELKAVAKDAQTKLLVAELQVQLAQLKSQLAELVEENTRLKEALKKAEAVTPEVALKGGLYFKLDGDGPYCTTCYDSEKKLIRVSEMGEVFRSSGRWRCGVCKSHYHDTK